MAFTFINSANSGGGSFVDTLTVNKPTNTADGDIMFAIINQASFSNSVPTGWTSIAQATDIASQGFEMELFYKIASSEGASYTWGFSSSNRTRGTIVTYRGGFNGTDPIDIVSNTAYTTSNSTCRAASMSVSSADSALLFVGWTFSTGNETFTKPTAPTTDWVEDYDAGDTASDYYNEVCSMVWTSSGATGDMDATMSQSTTNKHAFAVALNPESAGGTFTPKIMMF